MKRITMLFCTIFICALVFAGCSPENNSHNEKKMDDKVKIVVTTFPLYDWVRNLAPEAEITLLMDNGVDLHNYQPSAADIIKISNADLFIYVGGESDKWVPNILEQSQNNKLISLNLLETIGDKALEEEIIEGMEDEYEHDHKEEEAEMDEHLWLSLRNAKICCLEIEKKLEIIDKNHVDSYQENSSSYIKKIETLNQKFVDAAKNVKNPILLFGDRFPFRYFCEDYGLSYYAAFAGCSAETEASFETITFLADKVKTLKLGHVCVIEGNDTKIAEMIIKESGSNADILQFYSMQSVYGEDLQKESYLSFMEKNLDALIIALK